MLGALLGEGGPELETLKAEIVKRTQGNPFFIEEIIQSLYEQDVLISDGTGVKRARPFSEAKLPSTVQALLASRIDRLPADEKELLQTLAVIGKEFQFGLVKTVTAKSSGELERMLSALQLSEFIFEQPAVGEIEYTFKHALTQTVAYDSVLNERRKALHEKIGGALEELHSYRFEEHLDDLVHHYERSANAAKAIQ